VAFHFLWPVALISLLISVGVCVAAACQAQLPKDKVRLWSRPLVALLFFLQPIVRGWARYQGRLTLRPAPTAAQRQIESLQKHVRGPLTDYTFYWAKRSIDRLAFINFILARLDRDAWPSKADQGWCDFDVEIYGSRWNRLQLTIASEQWAGQNKMFRCRLRSAWSLAAKVAFWGLCGFELLIIGLLARDLPYIWMLLLTLPIFGWYFEQEKQNFQRLMAALLDEIAAEMKMTRLEYKEAEEKFSVV
jgi:hypothetical protein